MRWLCLLVTRLLSASAPLSCSPASSLRAGLISHTGVGGLTLGGGIGFCARYLGLTCDALVGARVVTSSGRILIATAQENADLYWVGRTRL